MKPSICLITLTGLLMFGSIAMAQTGRVGVGGARGSIGGQSVGRGTFNRGVNPNFNPPGSLSRFGNLNPRGSISPPLTLNPPGSLLRPRVGESTPALSLGGTSVNHSMYRPIRMPAARELGYLPETSVWSWAEVGLRQFESSLTAYRNVNTWRNYLQLEKVKALAITPGDQSLDDATRNEIDTIIERFEKIAGDPKFAKVAQLPGFDTVLVSLKELTNTQVRDRVLRSAKALNQALDDISGGKAWQEFLALPVLLESSNRDKEKDFNNQARLTAKRIEQINDDSRYRRITELPEFQAAAENLGALLQGQDLKE